MTSRDLVTAPVGTTLRGGRGDPASAPVEKLPIVDDDGVLKGLITVKDIQKRIAVPAARRRTSAAACASPPRSASAPTRCDRAAALVEAGADVLVVDTAHGHARAVARHRCASSRAGSTSS